MNEMNSDICSFLKEYLNTDEVEIKYYLDEINAAVLLGVEQSTEYNSIFIDIEKEFISITSIFDEEILFSIKKTIFVDQYKEFINSFENSRLFLRPNSQ